jgi:thioesterase domain-containing protein
MPFVETEELGRRLAALSPAKQRLLALQARHISPNAQPKGHQLVGFVAALPETDHVELQRYMANRLPHYMTPSHVVVLPQMPRTPNGKVDRAHLERVAREREVPPSTAAVVAPPLDDVEQQLRSIWADLLGRNDIGVHDDFFALGGHSLLAVRMLARVKAELGHDVPVALIVESPTIARLADHVRSMIVVPPTHRAITALEQRGRQPPLFFLPLHMHGALHYRHLKEHLGADRPLYGFAGFDVLQTEQRHSIESLAREYVEALLAYQPRGPYYLAGISIAGLLAYEMARQLAQRGIADVAVILFDTWGPGYPERLAPGAAAWQLVARFGDQGHRRRASITARLDALALPLEQGYSALKALQATMRRAKHEAANVAHEGSSAADNTDVHLHLEIVDDLLGGMTAAYLADERPYSGSVTLFRAGLQPWNARYDETLGWRRFVTQNIVVEHVRGDHLGILRRRHVANLAGLLVRRLAHLDQRFDFKAQRR